MANYVHRIEVLLIMLQEAWCFHMLRLRMYRATGFTNVTHITQSDERVFMEVTTELK